MESLAPGADVPDGVVVDIGGTKLMVGIVRDAAIAAAETFPTRQAADAAGIVAAISAASARLARRARVKIQGAAVAVPGALDRDAGVVRWAANLPFSEYPLAAELGAALGGVPVIIEHDANFGVVGEVAAGAALGLADVVYLTVSTGIGMGILTGGRVLGDARRAVGEIGHVRVVPGGRQCGCGSVGCLEAYASGEAIGQLGREALARGATPILAALVAGPEAVTAREVVTAAERGDAGCAQIIDQAISLLTIAIEMVLGILDPDLVVLGGGVTASRLVTERLIAETTSRAGREHKVALARLGTRSIMIGGIRFLPRAGPAPAGDQNR
jgi:glucokinase